MTRTEQMWQSLAEAAIELHASTSARRLAERAVARAADLLVEDGAGSPVIELRIARHLLDDDEHDVAIDPGRLVQLEGMSPARSPELVHASGTELEPWRHILAGAGLTPPAARWIAAPLRDAAGALVGILHVADTDRVPSEGALAGLRHLGRSASHALVRILELRAARHASHARDELVAMVSHDLRNPLNTIAMGLTLLERAPEVAPHRAVLTRLRRGTTRLNRIISDLLDVTRIESGTLVVERRALSPATLIDEIIDLLGPQAAEKSIRLEPSIAVHAPMILADRDRVMQVLMNLVGNAIKFTPEGGAVAVNVARHGDAVRFEVRDTGPGIPEEDLPHVFDRFWQARSTAKLGTGLGLFIAKGIVDAHGGKMHVESAEGLGTCVSCSLPVAPDVERVMRPITGDAAAHAPSPSQSPSQSQGASASL